MVVGPVSVKPSFGGAVGKVWLLVESSIGGCSGTLATAVGLSAGGCGGGLLVGKLKPGGRGGRVLLGKMVGKPGGRGGSPVNAAACDACSSSAAPARAVAAFILHAEIAVQVLAAEGAHAPQDPRQHKAC